MLRAKSRLSPTELRLIRISFISGKSVSVSDVNTELGVDMLAHARHKRSLIILEDYKKVKAAPFNRARLKMRSINGHM
jgi:hypothetical protein